jgi:Icc-related predicted phosphoesterase
MMASPGQVDRNIENIYDISMDCFFVSDLHGDINRYEKLFDSIETDKPDAVFIGGDILPNLSYYRPTVDSGHGDFINDFLVRRLRDTKKLLGDSYPNIFVILGNDDGRFEEAAVLDAAANGIWNYCHFRRMKTGPYQIYGYSYVPPTPFRLKDWERYDVSRFSDPGCIPIEDGDFSHPVSESEMLYGTIKNDLEILAGKDSMENAIFLFHTPPYRTNLDRAALDNKKIDHVPLDVHVGSIAVKRFIEERQPLLTLHGHVHESARITGFWKERIGRTHLFSAAHDGEELALVRFNTAEPQNAVRELR